MVSATEAKRPHSFRFWPTIGTIALIYLVTVVVEDIAFFPAAKLLGPADNIGSSSRLVVAGLGYGSALAAMLLLIPRISGRSLSELGLRRPKARDWLIATAGFVAVVLLSGVYLVVASLFGQGSHVKPGFENFHVSSQLALALYFAVLCFFGPAVEELFFRGFIFNALVCWMPANLVVPVILNGVIFGGYHGDAAGFLLFVADGVIFALLYRASRNLIVPMLAHVGSNTFMSSGMIFAFFGSR